MSMDLVMNKQHELLQEHVNEQISRVFTNLSDVITKQGHVIEQQGEGIEELKVQLNSCRHFLFAA